MFVRSIFRAVKGSLLVDRFEERPLALVDRLVRLLVHAGEPPEVGVAALASSSLPAGKRGRQSVDDVILLGVRLPGLRGNEVSWFVRLAFRGDFAGAATPAAMDAARVTLRLFASRLALVLQQVHPVHFAPVPQHLLAVMERPDPRFGGIRLRSLRSPRKVFTQIGDFGGVGFHRNVRRAAASIHFLRHLISPLGAQSSVRGQAFALAKPMSLTLEFA